MWVEKCLSMRTFLCELSNGLTAVFSSQFVHYLGLPCLCRLTPDQRRTIAFHLRIEALHFGLPCMISSTPSLLPCVAYWVSLSPFTYLCIRPLYISSRQICNFSLIVHRRSSWARQVEMLRDTLDDLSSSLGSCKFLSPLKLFILSDSERSNLIVSPRTSNRSSQWEVVILDGFLRKLASLGQAIR